MTMPNPTCITCGKTLARHRVTPAGRVYCLKLADPKRRPIKPGKHLREPLMGNPEAERRALLRCPVELLVESPLSQSPAVGQWLAALKPTRSAEIEQGKFPGLDTAK